MLCTRASLSAAAVAFGSVCAPPGASGTTSSTIPNFSSSRAVNREARAARGALAASLKRIAALVSQDHDPPGVDGSQAANDRVVIMTSPVAVEFNKVVEHLLHELEHARALLVACDLDHFPGGGWLGVFGRMCACADRSSVLA